MSEDYTPPPELVEIADRYDSGEQVAEILKDYPDISKSGVYYHFKKMGIETGRSGPAKSSKAEKTIKKMETEALAIEAEKIGSIALSLGGSIARRHLPLLDSLMSKNKTLEQIAEEIMDWYLSKKVTKKHIELLETEITELTEQLEYSYGLALPNYRYELRTRILERYATKLINARILGVKVPVRRSLKAFYTDLLLLEEDISTIILGVT